MKDVKSRPLSVLLVFGRRGWRMLWHGTSVFAVSSEALHYIVTLYDNFRISLTQMCMDTKFMFNNLYRVNWFEEEIDYFDKVILKMIFRGKYLNHPKEKQASYLMNIKQALIKVCWICEKKSLHDRPHRRPWIGQKWI